MTAPMMGGGMPARAMGPPTGEGAAPVPAKPADPAATQTCPKCGEKFPCQEEGSTPEGQTEDLGEWLKRAPLGGPQLATPPSVSGAVR
jgi:hypothetical protein